MKQSRPYVMNNGIIITFDVGGQIYRVSKDSLLKFHGTRLCMAASDLDTNNQNDPIVIERDGHRFQYVLDYIRHNILDLPSTINCIEFYQDMEYYGFRCDHDIYFPKDVKYLDGVQYHHVKWDVSRASTGLVFECQNQVVKLDIADPLVKWKSVMGTVGFTTGVHFWSLEILEGVDDNIMIGVSNNLVVTKSTHAGENGGASYQGNSGNKRYQVINMKTHDIDSSFGPSFSKGDVIGTLLNMNRKTLTFYKNGVRVGTAIDSNQFTGTVKHHPCVYPCLYLSSCRQEISSIGHNKIFTHN